jgi:Zinc dependent phospholipase C
MKKVLRTLLWITPFIFFAQDANAWGLVTHTYFAQSLLWSLPLLDPRLKRAIENFPSLMMAGACIPDLAIISRKFSNTHDWQHVHQLLEKSETDEELAIAIGYASHLYVDVIAHNHFVPAHEEMWTDKGMISHIISEWAMDGHLSVLMDEVPGTILINHANPLANFIGKHFEHDPEETKKVILRLAYFDHLLRFSKIPSLLFHISKILDQRIKWHFIYYLAKTQTAIADIGHVLSGHTPHWKAELNNLDEHQLNLRRLECLEELALKHPQPIRHFAIHACQNPSNGQFVLE